MSVPKLFVMRIAMCLAADAAFPLTDWLIKPLGSSHIKHRKHTLFNIAHSSTRMVVERTFGLFKRQWKIFGGTASEVGPETMTCYVECGLVFHNIMRRRSDAPKDEDEEDRDRACEVSDEIERDMSIDVQTTFTCSSRTLGRETQEIIADELWAAVGKSWTRELG